jgi:voltage-gated potassium channel
VKTVYLKARLTTFRIFDPESRVDAVESAGNIVLGGLIILNVIAVILETIEPVRERWDHHFVAFEAFSVAVFTVEYGLRLWSCVEHPRFAQPILGRLRYILSAPALVDAVAIVPAYMPGDVVLDLRFVRLVRVVRMARVLKIARYSKALRTFGNVAYRHRTDMALIVFFLSIMVVVAASAMYFVEHAAQPQVFSSIPAAMWWAVATLTTVGYGDIYPVTPLGKFIGSIIALIGIGFFALPAGILAAGFAEELQIQKARARKTCPHCGKELEA